MFIINISECLFLLCVARTYWIHFSDVVNKISFSNINCNLREKRRRRGRRRRRRRRRERRGRKEEKGKEGGEGGGRRRSEDGGRTRGEREQGRRVNDQTVETEASASMVHTCCTGFVKTLDKNNSVVQGNQICTVVNWMLQAC